MSNRTKIQVMMCESLQKRKGCLRRTESYITDWFLTRPFIDQLSGDPDVTVLGYCVRADRHRLDNCFTDHGLPSTLAHLNSVFGSSSYSTDHHFRDVIYAGRQ